MEDEHHTEVNVNRGTNLPDPGVLQGSACDTRTHKQEKYTHKHKDIHMHTHQKYTEK